MTDQLELNRLLAAFLATGTDELADRVIDAALDQIDHTPQRHVVHVPRRFQIMTLFTRLAAAAVIGALAVGATLYLTRPGQPAVVGGPDSSIGPSASPSEPARTATPLPSPAGPMSVGRQIHTATQLADGRVLVAGGYATDDTEIASADLYDPGTDTFSPTGSFSTGRGMHTATSLSDGRVLIAGGGPTSWVVSSGYLASAELYDPPTGTFSPTGSMMTTREDHTATLLADGRVLITGGDTDGNHGVASAELYDPQTGTFSPTGSMTTARGFHTATLLDDGRVLIVGGDDAAWSSGPFLATAEIYDPKTGTFSATGPMAVGREYHTATLLADGRVLVTGGGGDNGALSLASAELYDPKTGRFSPTGPMTDGRIYHTATLLADGRVLVAGGLLGGQDYATGTFLGSAELFDPKTGTFSPTGPMTEKRVYHAATVLSDGRVLVTGGADSNAGRLATAEIYDPATGTFSPAGSGG